MPSNESPAAPRADSPSSMPSLPKTTTAQTEPASLPVAPNSQISNSPAADVLLGSSATPDACAEQVAELTLGTCPAGLQLAADHAGVSKGNLSVLEELLGERELRAQLQAYGAQSESCCTSDDGCEDANVGNGSEVSYEAVSDSCSEEQEDYDAAREAVRKGDEGNEARLPRVFTLWRPFT